MASHIRTRSRCFSGSHSLPSTLGARRIFGRPRASSPACSERWEMVTARRHSPSRENTFTFGLPPLVSSPREQRRLRRATRHSSAEARPLQTLFQSFLPPKTTLGIVPFSRWALSSASFVSREATRAFRPFTARPSFSRTSEGAPLFTALASFFTVWPSLFLARPRLVCVSSMSLSSTSRWESRTAWALRRASSTYRELRPKSSWPSSFTVSREAPSTSREGPPLAGAKKAHLRRQGVLVTTGPAEGAEGRKCFREKLTGYRDDRLPLVPLRHGASAPEIPGALSGLPWPRTVARKTT